MHAIKRCRQRLGINKNAVRRQANLAYHTGREMKSFSGENYRWLRSRLRDENITEDGIRVHGNFVYLFDTETDPCLVTAYHLPKEFKQ